MRFLIHHVTRYVYSRPVFLEPHILRLRPRCDSTQRVLRFDLTIDPVPLGMGAGIDVEGNPFDQVWFDGLQHRVEIRTVAEVETLRTNPFDFLLTEENRRLPLTLDQPTREVCGPCLSRSSGRRAVEEDSVDRLVHRILGESGPESLTFLNRLNGTLFHSIRREVREESGIFDALTTLERGSGACRDVAVLFMEACRRVGIPARFVSGYQSARSESDPGKPELHAWAEVFLPGAGWRGYDPTEGLAVQDRHVALAASAHPSLAAPVCGTFCGTAVESRLETSIRIEPH